MRAFVVASLIIAPLAAFPQIADRGDAVLMRLDLSQARELKWAQTLKSGNGETPKAEGQMGMNLTIVVTQGAMSGGKSALAVKANMEGFPPSGNSQGLELNSRGALLKGAGQTFEFMFPTLPDLALKKGETWKATYPASLPQGKNSFTATYTFEGYVGEGATKTVQVSAVFSSDGWLQGTAKYTFNVDDGFMQTMDQSIVQTFGGRKGYTLTTCKRIP